MVPILLYCHKVVHGPVLYVRAPMLIIEHRQKQGSEEISTESGKETKEEGNGISKSGKRAYCKKKEEKRRDSSRGK